MHYSLAIVYDLLQAFSAQPLRESRTGTNGMAIAVTVGLVQSIPCGWLAEVPSPARARRNQLDMSPFQRIAAYP